MPELWAQPARRAGQPGGQGGEAALRLQHLQHAQEARRDDARTRPHAHRACPARRVHACCARTAVACPRQRAPAPALCSCACRASRAPTSTCRPCAPSASAWRACTTTTRCVVCACAPTAAVQLRMRISASRLRQHASCRPCAPPSHATRPLPAQAIMKQLEDGLALLMQAGSGARAAIANGPAQQNGSGH